MKKNLKKAFSLAELIVTVGILGVVVLLVFFNSLRDRQNEITARLNKAEAEINAILEMDYITHTGRKASDYTAEIVYKLLVGRDYRAAVKNPVRAIIAAFTDDGGHLKVKKVCNNGNEVNLENDKDPNTECWQRGAEGYNSSYVFILNDNTAVSIYDNPIRDNNNRGAQLGTQVHIALDATGAKGPNITQKDIRLFELNVDDEARTIGLKGEEFLPGKCTCNDGSICDEGTPKSCPEEIDKTSCKCGSDSLTPGAPCPDKHSTDSCSYPDNSVTGEPCTCSDGRA